MIDANVCSFFVNLLASLYRKRNVIFYKTQTIKQQNTIYTEQYSEFCAFK